MVRSFSHAREARSGVLLWNVVPIVNDAVLCLKILLKGQVTPKRKKEKAKGHQAPFGGDAASALTMVMASRVTAWTKVKPAFVDRGQFTLVSSLMQCYLPN